MTFKKVSHWIVFPWLIASYPILFLYAENYALVTDIDVLEILALTLAMTTVILIVFSTLTQDKRKGASLTSLVVVAFFLYGHLVNVISAIGRPAPIVPLSIIRITVFIAFSLTVIVTFILLLRMKSTQTLYDATLYLNLMSAALLFFIVAQIAGIYLKTRDANSEIKLEKPVREMILYNSPENPDIYNIVLDGYPSNGYFLREFGYDNSAFTNALEERGFFVAYDSLSNYGGTLASLPSSLNMRYLNEADRSASTDPVAYARWLLANNKTAYALQERGYTYIFMLSGFASPSDIADINIDFFPNGPRKFETNSLQDNSWFYKQSLWPLMIETTMAYPLAGEFVEASVNNDRPYGWDAPQRVLDTFNEAEKIPAMEEATFSFIHIIKPHIPIVFDQDGNIIGDVAENGNRESYFFAQLEFINRRTLQMIDRILEQSTVPPIIILQGDHGTRLGAIWRGPRDLTYFEILNAYHFPNGGNKMLSSSITPANTFRVMFNYYFGTEYELLEDHHYNMPDGYDDPFNLVEIDIEGWRESWEK